MGFKSLVSKFAGKTLDLMTEDTIQMQESETDLFFLLRDSSDQNFLDYVSAFVRMYNKQKLIGGKYHDFLMAFLEVYEKKPLEIQQRAVNSLEGIDCINVEVLYEDIVNGMLIEDLEYLNEHMEDKEYQSKHTERELNVYRKLVLSRLKKEKGN